MSRHDGSRITAVKNATASRSNVGERKKGYKSNPELVKIWRDKQPIERLREYEKTRNQSKVQEKQVKKRAKLRNACPSWLAIKEKAEINVIYITSREMSVKTGIPHEVDHIIPINGKNVCGLHVPWNLRIITRQENRKKYNKMEIKHG